MSNDKPELTLGIHRGAIDQTTITTQPPSKVMKHVNTILREMGVQIQDESTFHYRCIRAGRGAADKPPTDLDHGQGVVVSPLVFLTGTPGRDKKKRLLTFAISSLNHDPKILPLSQFVKNQTRRCMGVPLKILAMKFASQ